MGCQCVAQGSFDDDQVTKAFGLSEDESPMLIVGIEGASIPLRESDPREIVWFGGEANKLSTEIVPYPSIDRIHAATKLAKPGNAAAPSRSGSGEIRLPAPSTPNRKFGDVVRTRRSALDFVGGARTISLAHLSAILHAAAHPSAADFAATRFVQLYLYVHRVDELEPGVYRHWPDTSELERIKSGDQQVMAAGLSLGQELAGNACVTFSMIADLDRATLAHGDRGYRYVHFEAGAIGQRMYIAAEASGYGDRNRRVLRRRGKPLSRHRSGSWTSRLPFRDRLSRG